MSIMHIEIKEIIIRKHLNGMALRDIADHLKIAKNIEISKDTVNNIINEWRSGKINYHPDVVSDEESTIDLSKYIKRNNLSSNELGETAIQMKQIMAMGHTPEQIFFIFKALRNMTPENAQLLIDTVNRMDKNGINYTNLDAQINDLQIKEDNLEKIVNENQLTITEQQKSIQEYGKKIEGLKGNIKKEEKRLKDIKRNVYMQKKKLDLSREINSSLEKLHIDKAKLIPFLKDSCKFGYSSESFKNANEVWDSLPSNVNKPKAIIEVLDALKIINAINWDFNSAMELAKLLQNISGSKDEVIKIVSDIDNELKKVKNDILHRNTVRIQNMYGNNIGALLTDVLEGKKRVKSISHVLKKIVDSTIKNAVEKKLSEVIDSLQDNRMPPKFPVLTEVNGKLDVALVSYSAISKSLINHMDTVKGDVDDGEENVIVRMCDAVKFLALHSMDSRVDEDLRTQFRESLDKAKREHDDEIVSNRPEPMSRPVYTIKLGSRNESNVSTLV